MTRFGNLAIAACVTICLGFGASAIAAPVALFSGQAADAQLSPWGNGEIAVSGVERYQGHDSLEVRTKGYHEGGYLELDSPVPLREYLEAPSSSYIVFTVKLGETRSEPRSRSRRSRSRGRRGRERGRRRPEAGPPAGLPGLPQGATDTTEHIQLVKATSESTDPHLFYAQLPGLPGAGGGEGRVPGARERAGEDTSSRRERLRELFRRFRNRDDAGEGGPGGQQPGMMMPGMGMPGGSGGMMGPGMGMPGGGMMGPGMGMPGGGEDIPMGPGMGGFRRERRPRIEITRVPLASVRLALLTDHGQIDAGAFNVEKLAQQGAWREARVPFTHIKGPGKNPEAKVEALVFTGNSDGSFYIGSVEFVQE